MSKPDDLTKRDIYFYTCSKCGKPRRQSLLEEKASSGICAKCRRPEIPEGQMSVFDTPEYRDDIPFITK